MPASPTGGDDSDDDPYVRDPREDDPNSPYYTGGQVVPPLDGSDEEQQQRSSSEGLNCGDKRPLSIGSSDSQCRPTKVCVGMKPKAGDYDRAHQTILNECNSHYRCLLSTASPYPTSAEEEEWAMDCWAHVCSGLRTRATFTARLSWLVSDLTSKCYTLLTIFKDHIARLKLS